MHCLHIKVTRGAEGNRRGSPGLEEEGMCKGWPQWEQTELGRSSGRGLAPKELELDNGEK